MIRQQTTIQIPSGLHIFNVARLKQIVNQSKSLAFLTFKGITVNCNNIAGLLALGLKYGDKLVLLVDGIDEEEVAREILAFLENTYSERE